MIKNIVYNQFLEGIRKEINIRIPHDLTIDIARLLSNNYNDSTVNESMLVINSHKLTVRLLIRKNINRKTYAT